MTRLLPVQVVPRVAASAAMVFGIVTVMAGARVLLGGDPGYFVFRPLLLFNTVMGAVYVLTGVLVWRGGGAGRRLAGAIALVNVVVLLGISALRVANGPVARESMGAMAFRTLVWAAIWASLIWAGRRGLTLCLGSSTGPEDEITHQVRDGIADLHLKENRK
jgi:hypothetical protein